MTMTPGRVRKFPYFKVQARDPRTLSWKDHRKEAFDDEISAQSYRKNLPHGMETRIVKWDRNGSEPLGDDHND
jgi:hypothetical protein